MTNETNMKTNEATLKVVKHTPGPWCAKRDGSIVPQPDMCPTIATVEGAHYLEECKANACLIAAAPELLAALEHILEDSIATGIMDSEYSGAVSEARAAIAKAKGSQPHE